MQRIFEDIGADFRTAISTGRIDNVHERVTNTSNDRTWNPKKKEIIKLTKTFPELLSDVNPWTGQGCTLIAQCCASYPRIVPLLASLNVHFKAVPYDWGFGTGILTRNYHYNLNYLVIESLGRETSDITGALQCLHQVKSMQVTDLHGNLQYVLRHDDFSRYDVPNHFLLNEQTELFKKVIEWHPEYLRESSMNDTIVPFLSKWMESNFCRRNSHPWFTTKDFENYLLATRKKRKSPDLSYEETSKGLKIIALILSLSLKYFPYDNGFLFHRREYSDAWLFGESSIYEYILDSFDIAKEGESFIDLCINNHNSNPPPGVLTPMHKATCFSYAVSDGAPLDYIYRHLINDPSIIPHGNV